MIAMQICSERDWSVAARLAPLEDNIILMADALHYKPTYLVLVCLSRTCF